ncbi:MAG TPA: SDR family NAD(P)-dependent oxidoreductase [Micromonosporaceae bacterium]|nr:SDR family NAD(P)-dependent oxidoreductase [Micromonosporaceae bacterium]
MRTVVITGVSGGLGAALFDQLAARGDRVLALGRHFSQAQRALAGREPERVTLRITDLAEVASLPDAAELAVALRGAAGAVLLHNAAVVEPIGPVGALAPEQVARAVSVNLTAPMLLTNAFLAAAARPAQVLFISSGAARRAIEGWSVYCATKTGGEAFFAALAAEADRAPGDDTGAGRVSVACVNPGVMDTPMQGAIRAASFPDRGRYAALHARGELADPADVARKIISEHLTDRWEG